jgi:hypothetical protein
MLAGFISAGRITSATFVFGALIAAGCSSNSQPTPVDDIAATAAQSDDQYRWRPEGDAQLAEQCRPYQEQMAKLGVLEEYTLASHYASKLSSASRRPRVETLYAREQAANASAIYRREEEERQSRLFSRQLSEAGRAAERELAYWRRTDPPVVGYLEDIMDDHAEAYQGFVQSYTAALTGAESENLSFVELFQLAREWDEIEDCTSLERTSYSTWGYTALRERTLSVQSHHTARPIHDALAIAFTSVDPAGSEQIVQELRSFTSRRDLESAWRRIPGPVKRVLHTGEVGQTVSLRYAAFDRQRESERAAAQAEERRLEALAQINERVQALSRSMFRLGAGGWGVVTEEPFTVAFDLTLAGAPAQFQAACNDEGLHVIYGKLIVDGDAGWSFDADRGLWVDWGPSTERFSISRNQNQSAVYTNTIVFHFTNMDQVRRAMASSQTVNPIGRLVDQFLGGHVADLMEASNYMNVPLQRARTSETLDIYGEATINGQRRRLRILDLGVDSDMPLDRIADACGFFPDP